jgi:hypothetical protein
VSRRRGRHRPHRRASAPGRGTGVRPRPEIVRGRAREGFRRAIGTYYRRSRNIRVTPMRQEQIDATRTASQTLRALSAHGAVAM